MAKSKLPDINVLRNLLDYDPQTGILTWRARGPEWFKGTDPRGAQWAANNWNAKFAGKSALNCSQRSGYRTGAVLAIPLVAHRVAYAIHTGLTEFPELDHINGDRADNRIVNLRPVSHSENAQNTALYSSNTSGYHGVMWEKSHKAWAVKINIGGRQRRIGRFKNKDDAIAARKRAETALGYHPNHGRKPIGG